MAIGRFSPEYTGVTLPSAQPLGILLTPFGSRSSRTSNTKQQTQETNLTGEFLPGDSRAYNTLRSNLNRERAAAQREIASEAIASGDYQAYFRGEGGKKIQERVNDFYNRDIMLTSMEGALKETATRFYKDIDTLKARGVSMDQAFYDDEGNYTGMSVGQRINQLANIPGFDERGFVDVDRSITVADFEGWYDRLYSHLNEAARDETEVSTTVKAIQYDDKGIPYIAERTVSRPNVADEEGKLTRFGNYQNVKAAYSNFISELESGGDASALKAHNIMKTRFIMAHADALEGLTDDEVNELFIRQVGDRATRSKMIAEAKDHTTMDYVAAEKHFKEQNDLSHPPNKIAAMVFTDPRVFDWGRRKKFDAGYTYDEILIGLGNTIDQSTLNRAGQVGAALNDIVVNGRTFANSQELQDFKAQYGLSDNDYSKIKSTIEELNTEFGRAKAAFSVGDLNQQAYQALQTELVNSAVNKATVDYINRTVGPNDQISFNLWKKENATLLGGKTDEEIRGMYDRSNDVYYDEGGRFRYDAERNGYVYNTISGREEFVPKDQFKPGTVINIKHGTIGEEYDRSEGQYVVPGYEDEKWLNPDINAHAIRTTVRTGFDAMYAPVDFMTSRGFMSLHNQPLSNVEEVKIGNDYIGVSNTPGDTEPFIRDVVEFYPYMQWKNGEYVQAALVNVVVPDDKETLDHFMFHVDKMMPDGSITQEERTVRDYKGRESELLKLSDQKYKDIYPPSYSAQGAPIGWKEDDDAIVFQVLVPVRQSVSDAMLNNPTIDYKKEGFEYRDDRFITASQSKTNQAVIK